MTRKKLTYHERVYLEDIGAGVLSIREDYPRRLRNALLCLAQSDPHWMEFVEREIPKRVTVKDQRRILQLIESRARWRVLKRFNYFHRARISGMVFNPNWYFTDEGNLGYS